MTTTAKREGPRVRLDLSCDGCAHESSVSYRVQGDSGHDVYCNHPSLGKRREVGDTRWTTPAWCPLRDAAITTAVAEDARERLETKAPCEACGGHARSFSVLATRDYARAAWQYDHRDDCSVVHTPARER